MTPNTPSKAAQERVDTIVQNPSRIDLRGRDLVALELDRISEVIARYERQLNGGAGDFTPLRALILPPDEPTPAEVLREAYEAEADFEDDPRPFPRDFSRQAAALDAMGYEIRRKG